TGPGLTSIVLPLGVLIRGWEQALAQAMRSPLCRDSPRVTAVRTHRQHPNGRYQSLLAFRNCMSNVNSEPTAKPPHLQTAPAHRAGTAKLARAYRVYGGVPTADLAAGGTQPGERPDGPKSGPARRRTFP